LAHRPRPPWLEYVHQVETEAELKAVRRSAQGGTPFGKMVWQQATAKTPRSRTDVAFSGPAAARHEEVDMPFTSCPIQSLV
jgi:hypothetical protein